MDGNATNYSSANVSSSLPTEISTSLLVILIAFDIATILANGMVLLTVHGNPRLRTNTNSFITNLCLVDLVCGLVLMPLVIDSIARGDTRSGAICAFTGFIDATYSSASSLTIAVIALDRYHSIVNCLYYETIVTHRRTILGIVWIWFQTLFTALCPIVGWGKYSFQSAQYKCTLHLPDKYGFLWFVFCTSVLFPYMVIVFCYTQIHLVARRHAKNMIAIHIQDTGKRIKAVSTRKTKLVYLVVGIYTVCWLPIYIVKLLQSVTGLSIPRSIITLATVLSLVNGSCNPILYALITSQYRAGVHRLYKRFRRKLGRTVATPSVDQSKSSWSVSRPISNLYRYFQETDGGNVLACLGKTYNADATDDNYTCQKYLHPKQEQFATQRDIKQQTLQLPKKSKTTKKSPNGLVKEAEVTITVMPMAPRKHRDNKNCSSKQSDLNGSECKPIARINSLDRKKRTRNKDIELTSVGNTFKTRNHLEVIPPIEKDNCFRVKGLLGTIEEDERLLQDRYTTDCNEKVDVKLPDTFEVTTRNDEVGDNVGNIMETTAEGEPETKEHNNKEVKESKITSSDQ